jgi:hypothetical protein
LRASLAVRLLIACIFFMGFSSAQSPNGTISGIVQDPSGRAIPDAEIIVVNDLTNVQYQAKTNSEGIYVVSNLPPGPYRLQVSKLGFRTLIKPDLILNVQDALAVSFTLPLGSISEVVTVQGGAPLVNTQDAAVSTVIDRTLVASLPLNGRSFNTLLQLTPGVVIAPSTSVSPGQFSIGGQRTSANNFVVDGASANFGVLPNTGLGSSGTGSAQAFSAIGSTSSLVSADALQEFRIETSSFAPEFGHTPGGQVVLSTRSGTNDWHGDVFEYFRNDVLDANDWFANQAGKPRAPERHNDFGGVLGGPILKNKTFFFISYEGERLRLPLTSIMHVPSDFARASASSEIASVLNAYPQPNGTVSADGYSALFTGTGSNRASLDAGSVRIDHNFSEKLAVFGRYNEAPSEFLDLGQGLNDPQATSVGTRTVTVGVDSIFTPALSNAFRFNYSSQTAKSAYQLTSASGAVPYNPSVLQGSLPTNNTQVIFGTFDTSFLISGPVANNRNQQLNFNDDMKRSVGTHQLKFGFDYRANYLDANPYQHFLEYLGFSLQGMIGTNSADLLVPASAVPSKLLSRSFSLYAQDTWKATSRLNVTYGLRWEVVPAPSARGTTSLASWENVDNPAELSLAPAGRPVWATTYGNVAPRVGIALALNDARDFVLRAGGGIFFDLGTGPAANLTSSFPNYASSVSFGIPIPIADVNSYLPPISSQPPYQGTVAGFSPDLKLPRSYQWNVALEKSFKGNQSVSATYVGQAGRDLLRTEAVGQPNANFDGTFNLANNSARSSYNALQVQYRKPLGERLQVLLNYTFSHSLDNASNDTVFYVSNAVISAQNDHASSDFDVRHSFSGAVVVGLPGYTKSSFWSSVTSGWNLSSVVVVRTGFPFNAQVLSAVQGAYPRPDLAPNKPVWIANSAAPGGKTLNADAFTPAPAGTQGNEGRNNIEGFGLTQVDLSLGRKFSLTDRFVLEFRTDAFNLLNHPNFTNPLAYVDSLPDYLSSQSMLNHGLGGLNPLFQSGGPRSLQLSLKLNF